MILVLGVNGNYRKDREADSKMNRIEAFLYVLMRDELPTGKVVSMINDITQYGAISYEPSSEPLAALAREYASRLL